MQSYGPGPPSLGASVPSTYLTHYEGDWMGDQCSLPPSLQNMQTQALNHRVRQNEFNPFEKSFNNDAVDMTRSMSHQSGNNISAYQDLIDDYHNNRNNPAKRQHSPFESQGDLKRPKFPIMDSSYYQSESISQPSSRESGAESDEQKSSTPPSSTSAGSRKVSLANESNTALNFENMSQLNFGRLAQGFAQLHGNAHHQSVPAPVMLNRSGPSYVQPMHAPHPFRPEPISAHLQHMHDIANVAPIAVEAAPPTVPKANVSNAAAKKTAAHRRRQSQTRVEEEDLTRYDGNSANDNEEGKRAQFLERNRLAACRSRQKKKEWIKSLESSAEDMSHRNTDLEAANAELRDELAQFRGIIIANDACECGSLQALHGELSAKGLLTLPARAPGRTNANKRPAPPAMDFSVQSYTDLFDLNFDGSAFSLPTSVLDTPNLARETEFASTVI